jgi:hypothetical protein
MTNKKEDISTSDVLNIKHEYLQQPLPLASCKPAENKFVCRKPKWQCVDV